MQRTNIYLERRQTEMLDRLATDAGVSRAEIVRRLLDRALAGVDDMESDLAAFEESFGAVPNADVPARGDGEREEYLASAWQQT